MSQNIVPVVPPVDKYSTLLPNITSDILPKNSLLDDIKTNKCIETVVNEINQIPDVGKYRTDLELIKYVSNLVENLITGKDNEKLKKNVIMSSFQKVFSLTQPEQKTVSDAIDFLITNGQVAKIPFSKMTLKHAGKWIAKKIL
jgi:hypothetical protein